MKKALISLSMLALVFAVSAQDLEELLGQMTTADASVIYEKAYKFDSYVQMSLTNLGDKAVVYDGYLTKEGDATAILITDGGTNSVVVIDTKNNVVLLLSEDEGEKTGIAMGIDPEALSEVSGEMTNELKKDDYAPFKTGKTKDLLGYTCDEYVIKEDNSIIQMWVSPKLGKEIDQDLLSNEQVFGGAFLHASGANGMVMEYNFTDENSGENRSLKITKLDLKANYTVSTSDYAIMSIGQ